jgi:uncharacterized protein (TIGR02453 family)
MAKLSKNTLNFLTSLSDNNNKEWFLTHKKTYLDRHKEIKEFANALNLLVNEYDSIEKCKVLRIYRDVRFSKNKLPYKTHFGIGLSRSKPKLRGSYYLHIEPKKSFLACGFWNPEPHDLFRIRKEFEVSSSSFREIINAKPFRDNWGEIKGEELKTCPKNFDKNHPDIDLIRKKQFLFVIPFSDKEIMDDNFINCVNQAIINVSPFVNYMSEILTTNLNGESII